MASDFPNGYSCLEDKIDVFEDRVLGWQLNIAEQLIGKVNHSDYAKLSIVMSYFEMLGKHIAGYTGIYESKKHFLIGMKYVYQNRNSDYDIVFKHVYSKIRSGLYHVSLTSPTVFVLNHEGLKETFGYESDGQNVRILISPNNLISDTKSSFSRYVGELRKASNKQLRQAFEARFNFDNGITS
jgi:hypothetical protein